MAWFKRRSDRRSEALGNDPPPGIHRSPGLKALVEDLEARRRPRILDLGASRTENLDFFSRLSSNVTVQDLFRSSGGSTGQRAAVFQFTDARALSLPEDSGWDAVLLWDLAHYVERAQLPAFGERLAEICRPGGVLFLVASATAPIPTTPMTIRIHSEDRLAYDLDEGSAPSPALRTREIEAMLDRFEPRRLFQLRNGLMEMIFLRRDDGPVDTGGPPGGKNHGTGNVAGFGRPSGRPGEPDEQRRTS